VTRSILVGEVRTGRRITQIPVSGASWADQYKAAGEITVTLPLDAAEFSRIERTYVGGLYPGPGVFPSDHTFPQAATPIWRPGDGLRPELLAALEPGRCFLAVLDGDTVRQWGPIWTHDYANGKLQVKAGGFPSLFDHRLVMGVIAGTSWAQWQVTYSGLSLGTIAKRLVQLAMSHTGGSLPVVLPPDEAGVHERTYKGHELATVATRLEQISGVIGGPDVRFEPRLTADLMGVEAVMRVGTEANPLVHQAGGDHVWDASAVRGVVGDVSVSVDATRLAGRSWATGSGMDEALLMARADDPALTDAGFPLLEFQEAHSTVSEPGTLQDWAAGNLAATRRPWQTWKIRVLASSLNGARAGDFARVHIPTDHRYLSLLATTGSQRARILTITGSLDSEFVDIVFAPTQGV